MLDPTHFQTQLADLASQHSFALDKIGEVDDFTLNALVRKSASSGRTPFHLYLSSGVHGDEPAGPLAILKIIEADLLPRDIDITIVPLVNPTGFVAQTRENARGHDLNRDFRFPKNPETDAVKSYIERHSRFDLSIALHEDWESSGFYLYAISPDFDYQLARDVLKAVGQVGPIDAAAEIDGSPAEAGLISRTSTINLDERDDWPEAFLLYSLFEHNHFTLESPSAADLDLRISMLTEAVRSAVKLARSRLSV